MHFALAWLVLMAAVVGLSVFNAPVAAGVARISIATVAGVGLLLILSLAARGSDRAVMLIPTWYLLAVWVVAAGAAVLGYLTNDLAAPGPCRRLGADRHADRLHRDAVRVLRRGRRGAITAPTPSVARWP